MKRVAARFDQFLWRIPSDSPHASQSHRIETKCALMRVRDTGGLNKAVVFLCDPPITVDAYDELIRAFQPDYRVIVIELPGFGFSKAKNAYALSFAGAVEQVESALLKLELDRPVLFGPCICGFVAAEIAQRNKVSLSGVVLMQTPDHSGMLAWVSRMDPKGLLRIPFVGQAMIKLNAQRLAKFWLNYATAKAFEPTRLVDVTQESLKQGGGYPLATMLQLWSSGTRDTSLSIPGLIIWGKQDRSHAATNTECSRAHLPNSEIIEFAECGHFSELERPNEFAQSVFPFLETCLRRIEKGTEPS